MLNKIKISKTTLQNLLFILIIALTAIYIYYFSRDLSFDKQIMKIIYVLLALFVALLNNENTLYSLFFFLPLRKTIYFGSMAFFNIVLIILLIKMLYKNKKFPIKAFLFALILAVYDMFISMISFNSFSITPYMIKWYFSFFLFLYLLEARFEKYDYKKSILYLNVGLAIIGLLTIEQYSDYSIISSSLREKLAGAGGTLDQNTFSFFCLMGSVSILAFFLDKNKDKQNNFLNFIFIILGVFNFYCGMYMVSKAFYVVVLLVVTLILLKDIRKILKYLILILIFLFIALKSVQVQNLLNSIAIRFSNANDLESLTTGRSELLVFYINALLNDAFHFIFGAGISTYRYYYNAPSQYITHNTVLELIASWGIIGFVYVLSIIILRCKKFLFKKNNNVNFHSFLPLLTLLIFSFSLSMFWEDASLYFIIFSIYISNHIVRLKSSLKKVGEKYETQI